MTENFKVGDKVICTTGTESVGEIITAYIDYHKNPNLFIMWRSPTRTWYSTTPSHAKDLKHYQEPLKYSTGEEVKVGDLVYHSSLCEVGEVSEIFDKSIRVHNLNNDELWVWREFDKMQLRKRRGC